MLYHIAAKLKTVRDATTPENSKVSLLKHFL